MLQVRVQAHCRSVDASGGQFRKQITELTWPSDPDFWYYMAGKIGRSSGHDFSRYPRNWLAVALLMVAVGGAAVLVLAKLRGVNPSVRRPAFVFLPLLVVVGAYLVLSAWGVPVIEMRRSKASSGCSVLVMSASIFSGDAVVSMGRSCVASLVAEIDEAALPLARRDVGPVRRHLYRARCGSVPRCIRCLASLSTGVRIQGLVKSDACTVSWARAGLSCVLVTPSWTYTI